MNCNAYFKSTVRQPLRTLFLVLLIGFISFSFISRASEFIIIQRETNRLSRYYRAIGYLKPTDPNEFDVLAGAERIAQSQFIAYEDRQHTASGVLQGLLNADVDGLTSDYEGSLYPMGIHVSDVMIYGTLTDKKYNETLGDYGGFELSFEVDKVEAGYPEYVAEGETVRLLFYLDETSGAERDDPIIRTPGKRNPPEEDTAAMPPESTPLDGMEIGGRYFVKASFQFQMGLRWTLAGNNLTMKPQNGDGLWFVPVEPGESIDLDAPELAQLRNDLEVLRENQSAMLVTATKDMSALPNVQQVARYYYLADGRWLTLDDDQNALPVCVIHSEFANLRGLSVGDTLKIKLRDLNGTGSLGYITDDCAGWEEAATSEQEFEIVGLYGQKSGESTYHNTTLFIPASCLPEAFNAERGTNLSAGSYSFVLKSPRDEEAFLRETQADLQALGYTIHFIENNADAFWGSVTPLLRSAAVNAGIFGVVLLLALALAAFLYLKQRRREYAILRALGTPQKAAVRELYAPIALVGGLSVLAGGTFSWSYTIQKATKTLASIQMSASEELETSAMLSPLWLMALCALVFLVLMAFVRFGALRLAKRSTLELLQGERSHGKRKPSAAPAAARETPGIPPAQTPADTPFALRPLPAQRGSGFAARVRYMLRHMRRTPFKSAMLAAVVLCFTLALGWMNRAIGQNRAELPRMYANSVVEAEIVSNNPSMLSSSGFGIIRERTVKTVLKSGYVQSVYLEASVLASLAFPAGEEKARETGQPWDDERKTRLEMRGFDDPAAFFARSGSQMNQNINIGSSDGKVHDTNLSVSYAPGFDESLFEEDWTTDRLKAEAIPVVLSQEILELLGLRLGETVYLVDDGGNGVEAFAAGWYSGARAGGGDPTSVLLPLSALGAMEETQGRTLGYAVAKFVLDPAKNRELPAFRTEMRAVVTGAGAGEVPLNLVIWDEELRQIVEPLEKNLQLMAVLYPVTIALSALITAGLSVLLMLQNARDAAIMRVLGARRLRVQAVFCAEQAGLCLFGLALGLAALAFMERGVPPAALLNAGPCFFGTLAGSALASFLITGRKPLELLQVKE